MSELTKKRVHWKEYNGEELIHDEDVDVLTSADAVTFDDGETMQYKYNQGQFVSPSDMGVKSNLSTTNKSTLVDAINEVKTAVASTESSIENFMNRVTPISLGGTGATTLAEAWKNFQIYTDVTQLGLSFPTTTTKIFQAMPVGSIGLFPFEYSGNTITDAPANYGIYSVFYPATNRPLLLCQQCIGTGSNYTYFYVGYYNSSARKVNWYKIFNGSMILNVAQGGTGATTASEALANLEITATASELNTLDGITATTTELNYVDGVTSNIQTQLDGKAESNHNHSATDITSGTLPISRGGTGATTESEALANLEITATASELNTLDGITATTTELNYCDGVTSNIQTQLDGKAESNHNHSATDITSGTLPISRGGTGATTESGAISNFKTAIVNLIYPVGSYYWSSSSTSPGTLFGGTWTQVKDRFVLAAGSSYSVGSTGGEASHKLTVSEIPAHAHYTSVYTGSGSVGHFAGTGGSNLYSNCDTGTAGGGNAHNNMPPYIVAYCWRRTA